MKRKSFNNPTILVCPLDWGIGHATRCVPLIRLLLEKGVNVMIAADKRPMLLLQQEFPQINFVRFPGYNFSYHKSGSMALKMLQQVPDIIRGIRQENRKLRELIDQFAIDAVISDNRYGLYSDRIPSVFITHQIFIRTPWYLGFFKPILNILNWRYISRFDECWIPDFDGPENLSGLLSHQSSLPDRFFFVGPQSRFESVNKPSLDKEFDVLALLSGPEPQRTILENLLVPVLQTSGLKCAMVLGVPEKGKPENKMKNMKVFNHLESNELRKLILSSEWLVSRPGYSTIMDLTVLGKKAIFIPTPGQTEQEYLARHFKTRGIFYSEAQIDFNLDRALRNASEFIGISLQHDQGLLEQRVDFLLDRIKSPNL